MATIALVDRDAHQYALPWYATNPAEPIGGTRVLQVSRAVPLSPVSLDGLLDAILQHASRGDSIIVVGHAREGGLSMPLFPGSQARARAEIAAMLAPSEDDFLPIPARPSADIAPICQITPAQVDALRAKVGQIRALRLQHAALRACNAGRWPDVLSMYKPLFCTQEVSAPDRRDTYGILSPGAPESDFDRWLGEHADGHIYVEGAAPDRVAIQTIGGGSDDHNYAVAIAAESDAAFGAWAARNGVVRTGGAWLYHGQFCTQGVVGQPRIVFCATPDYARHLVVV